MLIAIGDGGGSRSEAEGRGITGREGGRRPFRAFMCMIQFMKYMSM